MPQNRLTLATRDLRSSFFRPALATQATLTRTFGYGAALCAAHCQLAPCACTDRPARGLLSISSLAPAAADYIHIICLPPPHHPCHLTCSLRQERLLAVEGHWPGLPAGGARLHRRPQGASAPPTALLGSLPCASTHLRKPARQYTTDAPTSKCDPRSCPPPIPQGKAAGEGALNDTGARALNAGLLCASALHLWALAPILAGKLQ